MADLITLEHYKTLSGIANNKDDEKLNILIPAISQLVKNYCNNPVIDYYSANTPYTEYFDIQWDTYTVQLRLSPIVAVVSVEERISRDSDYVALDANSEYWIDNISDSIFRTTSYGSYMNFPQGTGSVKVVYRAGFADTPTDLKLAVTDLITYYLKDERKERRTLGAASIAYPSNAEDGGFPDYIKRVLDLYKI